MKAIVQDRFGPPDVLQLVDTDPPAIGAGEVLIRVHAAALNPYDWHMLRGDPYLARLFGIGLTRPKSRIAGVDAAGRVEAVGADVRDLRPGDEVLGLCRAGALAEYARAKADLVVPKPAGLTFEQAAAVPIAGGTALRGVRDAAGIRAGQRVLVIGAGGGIGTFAIQIAVALGADVTGVCSTDKVELVRSLGAGEVADYTATDFLDGLVRYDAILDNVSSLPLNRLRRALAPGGTLVVNGGGSPGHLIGAIGTGLRAVGLNLVVRQRIRPLSVTTTRENLLALTGLIEAGKVTPVVGRTYPLAGTAEGLRYVEQGHARGKVVVTVA